MADHHGFDFEKSYMYGGASIRPNELILLIREDFESSNATCVGLYVTPESSVRIPLDKQFCVGVCVHAEKAHLIGQEGNTLRFDFPPVASQTSILQSRKAIRIEDVDEYLELTKVRIIDDMIYCCGQLGQLYRRTTDSWTRADQGYRSMDARDFEDIGGTSANDLYGIGLEGEMTRFDGTRWQPVELPTNQNLNAIIATGTNQLVVAGYNGLVLKGHTDAWDLIGEVKQETHYWDVAWHDDVCYLLHSTGIDYVNGDVIDAVELQDRPNSTLRRFVSGNGQLWIISEKELHLLGGGICRRATLI